MIDYVKRSAKIDYVKRAPSVAATGRRTVAYPLLYLTCDPCSDLQASIGPHMRCSLHTTRVR